MSLLPTQNLNTGGALTVYTAAALTNTFANSGRTAILIKNGSGSSINATFKSRLTIDGTAVPDKVVAIAAGAEKLFGDFDPSIWNDAGGLVEVDISVITTVTIAVFQN